MSPRKFPAQRALAICAVLLPALAGVMVACAGSPSPMSSSSTAVPEETAGCIRVDGGCLGVLAPGAYESTHFTTFGDPSAGQLSYTVDGSWANALDHIPAYWFQRAEAYAASNGDAWLPGVYVWGDVAAASQDYPSCPEASDPDVPTDAAGLLAWMATLPGVTATPTSAQIGEMTVDGLDIVVDRRASSPCFGTGPIALLIAGRPGAPDAYAWGVEASERAHVFLLDLGGGHTAAVFVQSSRAEFEELLPAAQELIGTFEFTAP